MREMAPASHMTCNIRCFENTAVKRYTHARDLRKAQEKQRQIEYKGVKSKEYKKTAENTR